MEPGSMDGLRPIGGQEQQQPSKEDNIDTPNNNHEEQPTKKREAKAIQPNQTLYIRNLNEKIKKDDMQHSLFHLFGLYGDILEITVKKNLKMKGQAFVVFSSVDNAQKAQHDLQGHTFFEKKMEIQFAKQPSDATLKARGEFDKYEIKKRFQRKKENEAKEREQKRKNMEEQIEEVKGDIDDIQDKMKETLEEEKRLMLESQKKTLTFENLPKNVTEDQVRHLLTHYQGIKDVFVNPGT
eukprot:CAMPEP_0197004468 /NCGR_PEP_ID=MMETSP1380-20130617/23136_1 /TAXON_ID=5936 /ORGANISM="Euplotes crassus, Strain CT5" /LENGTH=238 /DNA_ID=CAMNT_0042423265 /DNA_START=1 /DNA_END=718 /DNA_ORIENTATION=-